MGALQIICFPLELISLRLECAASFRKFIEE